SDRAREVMSNEGDLVWRLGLVDKDFRDAIVHSIDDVKHLNENVEAIGAGLGGGAVVEWAKHTMEAAVAVRSMSENLGITTDALQSWQHKVIEANGTQEEANRVLT